MTTPSLIERIDDLIDLDIPVSDCDPPWGGTLTRQLCPRHAVNEPMRTCGECFDLQQAMVKSGVKYNQDRDRFLMERIVPLFRDLREAVGDDE